jgi:hypothetical protein
VSKEFDECEDEEEQVAGGLVFHCLGVSWLSYRPLIVSQVMAQAMARQAKKSRAVVMSFFM